MSPFKGFADGKADRLTLPAVFVSELLPAINDIDELKVSLLLIQLLQAQDGAVQFVFARDFYENPKVVRTFGSGNEALVQTAVEKAILRGTFLSGEDKSETLYLLNTPRARAALTALQKGSWQPGREQRTEPLALNERPNIYQLYEANIGPLTPILAQMLDEAEKEYSAEWIEEAIQAALKKNVRNWSYVEAILRSWKEKGRGETDQRNHQENPRRYIEGDLADYIKH